MKVLAVLLYLMPSGTLVHEYPDMESCRASIEGIEAQYFSPMGERFGADFAKKDAYCVPIFERS